MLIPTTDDDRRAKYLAVYAERFGRLPKRAPEFQPDTPATRLYLLATMTHPDTRRHPHDR